MEFRISKLTKNDRAIIIAIFLLSVLVRLAILKNTRYAPYGSGMAQGSMARYLTLGRGFAINLGFKIENQQVREKRLIDVEDYVKTGDYTEKEEDFRPFIAYAMPGQGILLAGTYYIFREHRYIYLQIIQAIIDSLSVFMLYSIAKQFFNRKVGLLAAFLFAVWIPEARLAVSALRDAWMQVLMLTSLYFFLRGMQKERILYYLLSGLSIAIGVYFRSEMALLPILYGFIFLLRKRNLKQALYVACIMMFMVLMLLSPWTIRNYVVFHRFIPTNAGLWMSTWQSFGEFENDFGAILSDEKTYEQMQNAGYDAEFKSVEYDDLFKPKVFGVIKDKPFWYLKIVLLRATKIPLQANVWGINAFDSADFTKFRADGGTLSEYIRAFPVQFAGKVIRRITNLTIFLLAFVGIVFYRKWLESLILLSVPIYNILIHLPLGIMPRYILPGNTTLLIFASFALVQIFSRFKNLLEK